MGRVDHRPASHRWDACWHPEANELLTPWNYAAESPPSDVGSIDDIADEFLGALAALGGSAGNGRLRETLKWDEASYEAVKAELQSRRLIVPGRGRGGSVALADGSGVEPSGNGQAASRAPRTRASNGSRAASAPSSFEQAFRAIDDCLRKEAGCGTELDYTEQTSWLLFLKSLDGLEDDRAKGRQRTTGSQRGAHGRRPSRFCEPAPVPLPEGLQAERQRSEHD